MLHFTKRLWPFLKLILLEDIGNVQSTIQLGQGNLDLELSTEKVWSYFGIIIRINFMKIDNEIINDREVFKRSIALYYIY